MIDLVAGGLYSVLWEDGFQVVKVLAVDSDIVHLKIYRNKFDSRPINVDSSMLKCDINMNDLSGIGIGHLPVARDGFLEDEPIFIQQDVVTPEEMDAVTRWRYEDP